MKRMLVLLALSVGLVLPTLPATAATAATVGIGYRIAPNDAPTAVPTAMPGEAVLFSGSITSTTSRVVVLQRYFAGAWREVGRATTSRRWVWGIVAPSPGRYSYRAVVLRTATSGPAYSRTVVLTVVRPLTHATAPATVEVGRLLTVTGFAVPARQFHRVQLWELRGSRWVPVAESVQSVRGTFSLRLRAGVRGQHTYRAVTRTSTGRWALREFGMRSPVVLTATVPASSPGVRATLLADTTPVGALVGQFKDGPLYATGTFAIGARLYPKSVRTASVSNSYYAPSFSYELGAGASTFGTAVALFPVRRGVLYRGPRLVEISVDGVVRVRRFLKDGQAFPVTLDVRSKKVLTIRSWYAGPMDFTVGSDLLLATPVVTSEVRPERGAEPETLLTNLTPAAVFGRVLLNVVEGSVTRELIGGSMFLRGPSTGSVTASVDYELGGRFTRLVGVPALEEEVVGGLHGSVRIYGDGALRATLAAGTFSTQRVPVDVTDVHRLRIELVAEADPTDTPWPYQWVVMFGDPRLT